MKLFVHCCCNKDLFKESRSFTFIFGSIFIERELRLISHLIFLLLVITTNDIKSKTYLSRQMKNWQSMAGQDQHHLKSRSNLVPQLHWTGYQSRKRDWWLYQRWTRDVTTPTMCFIRDCQPLITDIKVMWWSCIYLTYKVPDIFCLSDFNSHKKSLELSG